MSGTTQAVQDVQEPALGGLGEGVQGFAAQTRMPGCATFSGLRFLRQHGSALRGLGQSGHGW